MKQLSKIALLLLSLSGLMTAHAVSAEPANTPASNQSASAPKKCDRKAGKEKCLETLKSDLKLNENQAAAWTDWADKIKGGPKNEEEKHPDFKSLANLPAPERMEKMLEFSKEHIVRQEARLAATKIFYETLTPEQRTIFNKGFNFEHHGHRGKHGGK